MRNTRRSIRGLGMCAGMAGGMGLDLGVDLTMPTFDTTTTSTTADSGSSWDWGKMASDAWGVLVDNPQILWGGEPQPSQQVPSNVTYVTAPAAQQEKDNTLLWVGGTIVGLSVVGLIIWAATKK